MSNLNLTPKPVVAAAEANEAKIAEAVENASIPERRRKLVAEMRYLESIEARQVAGARVLTPKQVLMDTTELEAKNPDTHYRWGNQMNKEKMEARKQQGYEVVPESEGGRRLGDEMVLLRIPRERAEAIQRRYDNSTASRLESFKSDHQAAVENVARELRDRHGIRVDPKKLLVDER